MLYALKKLFRSVVTQGSLTIIDADDAHHVFGDGSGVSVVVRLKERKLHWKLAVDPAFHLGEAYLNGSLVIERGTIYDLLEVLMRNLHRRPAASVRALERLRVRFRRLRQFNPVHRSRRNVAHHYDLDANLYGLFLDSDRQYSCAYFEHPEADLEEAQHAKKRHIAAKLALEPGQKVLDIGSGWGGLGLYLARENDVSVTGITLSEEQLSYASRRANDSGMANRVSFHLQDYRETDGPFDRIVSVGMFEHVGIGHYRDYFDAVGRLLGDNGVALIHTIGRSDGPGTTNPWMQKYIFPGGYAPALSEMLPAIEQSGLIVTDVEVLRLHYAHTLKHWLDRFLAARESAAAMYDEQFCRMWEFYLAGCELAFRYQHMNVFQLQVAKSLDTLPITRDYMIDRERNLRERDLRTLEEPHRLAGE